MKQLSLAEKQQIERSYDTVVLMSGNEIGLKVFINPKHPGWGELEPLGLQQLSLRMDELEETAKELGLESQEISTDWNGRRYCVVTDPDRNMMLLCED